MISVLFDTNILIDHFAGVRAATDELERYEDRAISTVTWLEVLSGALPHELQAMRDYMTLFIVYDLDDVVAEAAAALRRGARANRKKILKTPDAAVLATAQCTRRILITRNVNDFTGADVHVPYLLERDRKTGEVAVRLMQPIA